MFSSTFPATHLVLGRSRSGEDTGDFDEVVSVERMSGGVIPFLFRARALCVELRPDIVHLHSSVAGLARVIIPAGPRIVYSPHCFAFERCDLPRIARSMARGLEWLLGRRRQIVAAVSPHERELAKNLIASSCSAELTPNASGYPLRVTIEAQGDWHVVTCGRIGAQKDPEFFAEVARRSSAVTRFTWVGDGDPELRSDLEAAGVTVTGWLAAGEIQKLYARATLYLHTAQWEASPYALLDAAQCGLPVLVRSIASLESLGYASAVGGPSAVAKAIDDLRAQPAKLKQVVNRTAAVSRRNSTAELARALDRVYG